MAARKTIDVTGLSAKQIAAIEEIVAAFRAADQVQHEREPEIASVETDEELARLHEQFNWLVADLGIKEPLSKENIYDLN